MAYSHTNSKGNTYYLHSNGRMFFFSKEVKDNALDAIPDGYHVSEMKTGMLVLKKNQPAETAAPAASAPMATPTSEAPASDVPASDAPTPMAAPASEAPASDVPASDAPSEGGM